MKGLGSRIKVLRKARKLTLVEIARKTGIDQATLSRIENGRMVGTLSSHMRIAEALGVRLTDLYNQVIEKLDEAKEKALRQKVESFSHSSGAVAQLLTTNVLHKKMMPVLLKLKPRGRTETEQYPAGTERFLYVVKGALELSFVSQKAGRKETLKPEETLYFDASQPHSFRNTSSTELRCISVLTPSSL